MEEVFHFQAGLRAHFFEHFSAFPDENAFLGIPHYVNDGGNLIAVFALVEGFNLYLAGVGDFLAVVEENLLPQDFRCKEAQVLVRELVFVEPGRGLRQAAAHRLQDAFQIEFLLGRCRNNLRLGELFLPPAHEFHHLFLGGNINLVDDHYHRAAHFAQFLNIGVVLVPFLHHVRHVQDNVGVPDGRVHKV